MVSFLGGKKAPFLHWKTLKQNGTGWLSFEHIHSLSPRSGLQLNLVEEAEEVEELHLKLPPPLSVQELRCLSVWEGDSELGAAFLRFPTRVPKIGWTLELQSSCSCCINYLWYIIFYEINSTQIWAQKSASQCGREILSMAQPIYESQSQDSQEWLS